MKTGPTPHDGPSARRRVNQCNRKGETVMPVKVKHDGEVLKIYLPLEKPHASKSGKTMLIASTYGVQTSEVEYEGRKIVVVANAFIYPREKPKRNRTA